MSTPNPHKQHDHRNTDRGEQFANDPKTSTNIHKQHDVTDTTPDGQAVPKLNKLDPKKGTSNQGNLEGSTEVRNTEKYFSDDANIHNKKDVNPSGDRAHTSYDDISFKNLALGQHDDLTGHTASSNKFNQFVRSGENSRADSGSTITQDKVNSSTGHVEEPNKGTPPGKSYFDELKSQAKGLFSGNKGAGENFANDPKSSTHVHKQQDVTDSTPDKQTAPKLNDLDPKKGTTNQGNLQGVTEVRNTEKYFSDDANVHNKKDVNPNRDRAHTSYDDISFKNLALGQHDDLTGHTASSNKFNQFVRSGENSRADSGSTITQDKVDSSKAHVSQPNKGKILGSSDSKGIVENAKDQATGVVDDMKNKAGQYYDAAKDKVNQLTSQAQDSSKDISNKAGDAKGKAEGLAQQAKDKLGQVTDDLKDKAQQLKDQLQGSSSDLSNKYDQAKDQAKGKAEQLRGDVQDKANQAKQQGKEGADSLKSKLGQVKDDVKGKAEQYANQAKDKLDQVKSTSGDLGHKLEQVKDKAGEYVNQAKDKASEYANQAKEKLKGSSGDLSHNLEQAKDKAGQYANQAKDKAGDYLNQAKNSTGDLGQNLDQAKDKAGQYVNQAKDKAGEYANQAKNSSGDLGQKFEQVKDKAGQYVNQAKDKAGDYLNQAKNSTGDLGQNLEQVKDKAGQYVNQAKDKAGEYLNQAKNSTGDLGQNLEQVKDKAGQYVNQAKEKAGEYANQAKDKFEQAKNNSGDLGHTFDQAKDKAGQYLNQAKDKAEQYVNQAKGSSGDLGHNAEQAKDKAGQYADQAKDKAGQYAGQAKDKAEQYANQAKDKFEQLKGDAKDKAGKAGQQAKDASSDDLKQKFDQYLESAKDKGQELKNKAEEKIKDLQDGKDPVDALKAAAGLVGAELGHQAENLLGKDRVDSVKDAAYKAEDYIVQKLPVDNADEVVETAQGYASGVSNSFRTFIDAGPSYLTEFKKQYVFPVNKDYRTIGHAGFTLAFLFASLKFRRGLFVSLKNTAVASVVSGLVFNPEPFNPFLKRTSMFRPNTNNNSGNQQQQ